MHKLIIAVAMLLLTGGIASAQGLGINVKSGANGCPAAAGNGANDDTQAINCQLTHMHNATDGGLLNFPCGNYRITATVQVYPGTRLEGENELCTVVSTNDADITAIRFNPSANNNGNEFEKIANMLVTCNQSFGATNDCTVVETNVVAHWDTVWVRGGRFALNNKGCDGTIYNVNLEGNGQNGGNLISNGGNWYIRGKFDNQSAVAYSVYFNIGTTNCFENSIIETDFSGPFTKQAIYINDIGTTRSMLKVIGGVVGGKILNQNSKWLSLSGVEIQSNITSNGKIDVVGSGPGPLTVSGTGARSCSGNTGITC